MPIPFLCKNSNKVGIKRIAFANFFICRQYGHVLLLQKTAAKPHRIPSAGIGNSLSAAIFPSGGSDRKSCIVEAADKNKGGGTEHP
jgi:hypothetical protein